MENINVVCKIYTGNVYIETNNYYLYVTVDVNKGYLYFLICKNSRAIHILFLCKYVLYVNNSNEYTYVKCLYAYQLSLLQNP